MELSPIVFSIGPNKTLTPSSNQTVDFSGATRLSRAEAAQYKLVTPLVADAERRAMQFQRSTKANPSPEAPAVDEESTGDPLRDFIRWVVKAREDLAKWDPTDPGRDDDRSPSALGEEHVKRQRLAVDAGADGRVVAGIELRPPGNLLARDAENRLIRSIAAGQQVRIG